LQSALFCPPLIAWAAVSVCLLVSPLQAQDLHITLLNGDCDGDNEVTLLDFGIVVSAMGSVPGDPNWEPRADLDGDGEVTLFDFGIVERNFGQVGAEPFDPTLPRMPAASEGYALQGSVELQDWVGAPQPVRIEALREDDPDQIVYWMEVQSGEPFTLHLPRSGLWWVKVSGAPQGQARHLTGQSAAKRYYLPGDPIQAFFITPREGEAFADAALEDAPIGVSVYAQDYDDVFSQSADGSRTLSNRERTTYAFDFQWSTPSLLFQWEIVSGGGSIAPIAPYAPSALYFPPVLEPYEYERTVTVRCTIIDFSPDLSRMDSRKQITRSFRIVKRPTVHLGVEAVDPWGNLLSTTPIPSGQGASRLSFTANKRGRAWKLESVTFTTPWGTQTVQNPDPDGQVSVSFTTEPISPDEPHRRFQFGASAVFSMTLPPPVGRIEQRDEKTGERLLGFDIHYVEPYDRLYTNELIDDSRGQSVFGTWPVPNWFHNRPGHWGAVVPRFNEEYGLRYPIVHWLPMTLEEILEDIDIDEETSELLRRIGAIEVLGIFDFMGALGPEPFAEQYRGRIYILPAAVSPLKVEDPYALTADGIDLLARVVTHEFAHRDQFLRAWGGFSDEYIRPRGVFLPGNRKEGSDDDGDGLSNDYEESAEGQWYQFNKQIWDALYQWWMGQQGCQSGTGLPDAEMYARLFGEWNHYWIGSLDEQDYSVGGRLDY